MGVGECMDIVGTWSCIRERKNGLWPIEIFLEALLDLFARIPVRGWQHAN